MYFTLKHIHLTTVAISFALFFIRGVWRLRASHMLRRRWVRIVPHINDTVLFAAGLWLAIMLRLIPGESPWFTAKLAALALYIGLGNMAFRRGRTRAQRTGAWIAAMAVFFYIVAVAITKNPAPWHNV